MISKSTLSNISKTIKRSKQSLLDEKEFYKSFFDLNPNGIIVTNLKGKLLYFNKAFQEISGYKESEIIAKDNFRELLTNNQQTRVYNYFKKVLKGEVVECETTFIHKDGILKDIRVVGVPMVIDGKIQGMHVTVRDITKERKLQEQIKKMAYYDPITGLPNRNMLKYDFSKIIDSISKAAIFFIDLDGFKQINDTFGHDIGDILLDYVARRFKKNLKKEDKVYRIGGDEFVILLMDIEKKEISIVAQRLLDSLESEFLIKDKKIIISPSIGISYYPNHGKSLDELLKFADDAMYDVKKAGKNNYRIYNMIVKQKAYSFY